jgi:hypothetical protein
LELWHHKIWLRRGEDASAVKIKEAQVVLRERKTLASNFILARALIEIVLRLNSDGLSGDLGDKLEEMVFNQLVNFDSYVAMF